MAEHSNTSGRSNLESADAVGIADVSSEVVILIHGLCGHRLLMSPLARRLKRRSYRTVNWGYRSLTKDIEQHARRLFARIEELARNPSVSKIHIVAHSLGSIITRQALAGALPQKLGRIVMIGPPNCGSHAATRAEPLFGRFSRTLCQIVDRPDSWVNQLECGLASKVDVGVIIAGGDLVVARQSTSLPGVQATTEVAGMHSGILFKRATAEAIMHFLSQGKF